MALGNVGLRLSPAEMKSIMKVFDADGNGSIDLALSRAPHATLLHCTPAHCVCFGLVQTSCESVFVVVAVVFAAMSLSCRRLTLLFACLRVQCALVWS